MSSTPPMRDPETPLASVLEKNIRVLDLRREFDARRAGLEQRVADAVTEFAGSMWSVYLHLLLFGFWIIANLGWVPGVPQWDPSFVMLAMWASVEAIFLSTFVLISQNRMSAEAKKQSDLDLQINLLAEHEVTRLVEMVDAIGRKLEIDLPSEPEIQELKKDVAPEAVLDHIESTSGQNSS